MEKKGDNSFGGSTSWGLGGGRETRAKGLVSSPFTTVSAAIYGETPDHFHARFHAPRKTIPRLVTDIRYPPNVALNLAGNYSFLGERGV